MQPDPASKNRFPPADPALFKADTATLTFYATAEGKLKVVYAGWDEAKIVLPGCVFELARGPQGVEGRIRGKGGR